MVVIQDRSIVWKYMFKAAAWESTHMIDQVTYWKHSRMKDTITIPDLIFVLQPSQEALLERLEQWYDPEQENADFRHGYKKEYITQSYHNYYWWISLVPEHIQKKVHHIKDDGDHSSIHTQILAVLEKTHIFEGEDYDIER